MCGSVIRTWGWWWRWGFQFVDNIWVRFKGWCGCTVTCFCGTIVHEELGWGPSVSLFYNFESALMWSLFYTFAYLVYNGVKSFVNLNKGWEKGHRIYFFFSSNQLNLVLHWDFGNKSWWESEIPLSDIKLHLMPAWNFNLLLLYYHSNWRVYGVEIIFIECWKMADNAR